MIDFPNDWKTVRIGQLFDIKQGKSLSRRKQTGNNLMHFLRTSNVHWGRLDLASLDEMNFTDDECNKLALHKGDLLVCEGGDIGRTAIWQDEVQDCYYQNHLHRLRRLSVDVSPFFVMYWMQAAMTQLNVYEGAWNKTTIPNLSRSRLSSFEIPLPPILEQKKIAEVLLKIQRAIETQERIIQSLRDLKKSTMQHLFTHGLRGEKTKMTEIGEIPESWAVKKMDKILSDSLYGLSMRGQTKGQYPILRMNCQVDGVVVFDDLQYVDLDQKAFEKFRLVDGDLLFNRTNSHDLVGRMAIFHSSRESVFASYLIRLRLDRESVDPDFVNYYFYMNVTQTRVRTLASRGVSQSNISASKLQVFQIPMPADLNEQNEIVEILRSVDRKIQIRQCKKSALQDLFKTTLNKLMTGEIQITDLEIDVSEVEV